MRDRSELGEFFLEIQQATIQQGAQGAASGTASGGKNVKRIAVIDIDDIEPVQGTKF